MANEIRATATLNVSKNGFSVAGNSTKTLTISGSQYLGTIQSIGTSYEAVGTGDLSDIRYMFLLNQSTASVSVAMHSASQSFAVMQPNDILLLSPSGSSAGSGSFMTYQLKSTEAGSDVQVVVVES